MSSSIIGVNHGGMGRMHLPKFAVGDGYITIPQYPNTDG